MAISNFPSDAFVIEGDPEAVAESGRAYGRSAALAAEAAEELRGTDSGAWSGASGDRFREALAALPPRLGTAERAFAQVAQALTTFAETLAEAQRQITGARDDAEQTFRLLAAARADRAGGGRGDTGRGEADALSGRITALEATLEEQLTAAARIRARVEEAARETADRIRASERASPPGGGWRPAGVAGPPAGERGARAGSFM